MTKRIIITSMVIISLFGIVFLVVALQKVKKPTLNETTKESSSEVVEGIYKKFELEKDIKFGDKLEGNLRFGFRQTPGEKELFGLLQFINPTSTPVNYSIEVKLLDQNKKLIAKDNYTPLKSLEPDGLNASSLNFHLSEKETEKVKYYTLQYEEK